MNRELVQKWVEALRSGNYEQGRSRLKYDNDYCCLGVAASIHPKCSFVDSNEVMNVEKVSMFILTEKHATHLPDEIKQEFGLSSQVEFSLIRMNDIEGKTFSEIADFIEANLLMNEVGNEKV